MEKCTIIIQHLGKTKLAQPWIYNWIGATDDLKHVLFIACPVPTSLTPTIIVCDHVSQFKLAQRIAENKLFQPILVFIMDQPKEAYDVNDIVPYVDVIFTNLGMVSTSDNDDKNKIFDATIEREVERANQDYWKPFYRDLVEKLQIKQFQIYLKLGSPSHQPEFVKETQDIESFDPFQDDVTKSQLITLRLYFEHRKESSKQLANQLSAIHSHKTLRILRGIEFSPKELQRWIELFFKYPFYNYTTLVECKDILKISVINLKHRTDLWQQITDQFVCCPSVFLVTRFDGSVDGYQEPHALQTELFDTFPNVFKRGVTDKRLEAGELGCWLSHIRQWREIASDKKPRWVVENQAILGPIFMRDAMHVEQCCQAADIHWLWAGYHVEKTARAEMILDVKSASSAPILVSNHPIKHQKKSRDGQAIVVTLPQRIGGTFAIRVDSAGAETVLKWLSELKEPILYPIDVMLFEHGPDDLVQYACLRPLIWHSYDKTTGDIVTHQRNN